MLHRLRTAGSALFAVVSVSLCILWVQGSRNAVGIVSTLPGPYRFGAESRNGEIRVGFLRPGMPGANELYESMRMVTPDGVTIVVPPRPYCRLIIGNGACSFRAPIWPLMLASAAFAISLSPPLSFRFSLRTLLAFTTVVAVVLTIALI
jgi:hypothetical protein